MVARLGGTLSAILIFVATANAERVVSVGGPITEIIYALGQEATLVGVDTSSIYPEAATKLPQVGYQRLLAAEGMLSLRPTLIIATEDAGPPTTIEQVKASGVRIVIVPGLHSIAGVKEKIRAVAHALNCEPKGEEVVHALEADEAKLAAKFVDTPHVLFIYARGGGVFNVSGEGTAADSMISLSGGVNAVRGYHGYKPLTPEAAVTAAPDVILISTRGLESVGGVDKLLAQGGLALTPAGKNRRIIAMDELYLLGFGPRTGRAVQELAARLHEGN